MTDIILHHYEISPYSEKVRLGLGLKGLAWGSVEIPVIMPKPDLTALTGGYRKTPVLQIGADIYCDSQLIMRELERRHPTPSFYPAGHGAADALAWWAEKTMFSPAAGILFAKRPDALPEGFLEDRAKFSGRNIDPGRDDGGSTEPARSVARAFRLAGPDADRRALIPAGLCRWPCRSRRLPSDLVLETEFRANGGAARRLSEAAELGRAHCRNRPRQAEPNDLEQALDAARDATSIASVIPDPRDPIGRKPGQTVTVTPDDTGRDPVVGELVASGVHEIVIRRSDPAVGEVCVHFPRAGFVVTSA